jgi:hypothetical protein
MTLYSLWNENANSIFLNFFFFCIIVNDSIPLWLFVTHVFYIGCVKFIISQANCLKTRLFLTVTLFVRTPRTLRTYVVVEKHVWLRCQQNYFIKFVCFHILTETALLDPRRSNQWENRTTCRHVTCYAIAKLDWK